ncbi:MAG: M16 family metallopeptidase [Candidatus Thermochlorobacter sp.]
MRKLTLILLLLSLAVQTGFAQRVAKGNKTARKKIEFVEYDLPNGLHVILHQDRSLPVVATYVLYHVGSKNERPDRTGFAHFFEHLMFEGTENIKRGQIDKLISGAGGNLNASTSFDRTDYFFNLPSNQLKLALWIESERMMHAKIDSIGVETQRQVVKEERRLRYENQPYGTVFFNMAANVFEGTPYSWTPIGEAQYIDQASIEEFRDFYKQYYVPNNATLAIAGDFDIEETKKLVEAYFGPIPRGKDIERPKINFTLQDAPKYKEVVMDNTPLPATIHAWRATTQRDKDAYAIEMLTSILANGKSSRLYKRMVEDEQVAVQTSVFPFLQEDAGMIAVIAVGNSGVEIQTMDKIIDEEIKKIADKGITAEELEKAKNQKESETANAFGSMFSRAVNLANYYRFHGNTNLINTELDEYLKVTRQDIQRVARKYLTEKNRTVIHYPTPDKKKNQ